MRINCTESFGSEPQAAEATWQAIRRIVDARLAEEIRRRVGTASQEKTA